MSGGLRTGLGGSRIFRFLTITHNEVSRLTQKADKGAITLRDMQSIGQRSQAKNISFWALDRLINEVAITTINSAPSDEIKAGAVRLNSSLKAVAGAIFKRIFQQLEAGNKAGTTTGKDLEELKSFLRYFPEFCAKPGIGARVIKPILDMPSVFDAETVQLARETAEFCISWIKAHSAEANKLPAVGEETIK